MISSPCRNCDNKYKPKDECLADCSMIQRIQDFQSNYYDCLLTRNTDGTEESRVCISNREAV